MIPFQMIVLEEFGECPSEVPLAEWNHSIETFLFDRSHETLCVRIRIRRLDRGLLDAETSLVQQQWHPSAPLLIPIADPHAVADQLTANGRHRSCHLAHEQLVRMWRRPEHVDPS